MKKLLSIILCLILVMGCFHLAALADTTIKGDGETNIPLTTGVPELSSITVTPPAKTTYNVGDELDTNGMTVMANYNYTDDTPKDVTSAATLSGFDSSAAGQGTVTVTYTEREVTKTDAFTVTIVDPSATTYTISVSADPADGGTVSGGGEFAENANVTVTATANSGYSFVKWTENGEQVSTNAAYTFQAAANRTLVAVFEADEIIYTITVEPGDGAGEAFTVQSTSIISRAEKLAGNYDASKGCFYLDNDGKVYYSLPSQCAFTVPDEKESDCWEASFGGTFDGGTIFEIARQGNFTITALYKDAGPQETVTISIPATINVEYGDTQTPFDVQVKSAVFSEHNEVDINMFDSVFTCEANGGTIPFSMTTNGNNASVQNAGGRHVCFEVFSNMALPYTCQGFINITSEAWAAAKPGYYTATLLIHVLWW